jgi:D-psicose/D-tagatose/L-ribulose 3-epimerase
MSGRLGVHALVWVGGWSREECERAVAATAQAGYDLIEIPLLDPSRVDVRHTRAVLREHGVAASCSLGLTAATDVSSDDEATVAAGRALLHDALVVAREIGARYLGGVVYGALGRYVAPPTARGRANAVGAVRELCAHAEADGITIGLETVNRYETNLLNTAEQTLAFADEVGAPNVAVHLDTYHMHIEEADLTQPILACGDRLGYVHVGESHRGPLGTGNVDWPQVFAALERSGYAGDIAFESFSSAVVDPELSSTLCIWRELWEDGMALARAARRFVEEGRAAAAAAVG